MTNLYNAEDTDTEVVNTAIQNITSIFEEARKNINEIAKETIKELGEIRNG